MGRSRRGVPNHPLYAFLDALGTSLTAWSDEHKLSRVLIQYYIAGQRKIPPETAARIAALTAGKVPETAWTRR